jgi:uncharacterized protein with FMN-binding domain
MTHPHHPKTPKTKGGSGNKIGNNLVALSSAAVLTVYAAGYLRTSAAADRLEASSVQRRSAAPVQALAPHRPGAPETPANSENQIPQGAAGAEPESASPPAAGTIAARTAARKDAAQPVTAVNTVPNRDAAPASTDATNSSATAVPEPVPAAAPVVAAVDHPVPEPVAAPVAPAAPKYRDGTYLGWGTSRHGDIQAAVVIEGGRIVSATIAQCWTRYSCSWIADLPPQVVKRQSPEVDYVSGATQSTNAFYYGIVEALAKAKGLEEN